jgi:hypothetical protein
MERREVIQMRVAAQELEHRAAEVRKQASEWLAAEAVLEERKVEAAMPHAPPNATDNVQFRAGGLQKAQDRLQHAVDALQDVGFVNLLPD